MATQDDAFRITTAAADPRADTAARQKRYVISMTIRMVCFLAAAYFAPEWPMWILLAGAIFLPYVAVVGANAKDMRSDNFKVDVAGPQFQLPGGHRTALPHDPQD